MLDLFKQPLSPNFKSSPARIANNAVHRLLRLNVILDC